MDQKNIKVEKLITHSDLQQFQRQEVKAFFLLFVKLGLSTHVFNILTIQIVKNHKMYSMSILTKIWLKFNLISIDSA